MSARMTAEKVSTKYNEFQTWIRQVVSKFIGRYGGNWDELFSEANYLFVKHCYTWNPRRGPLNKHISFRIWVGLLDLRRSHAKYYARNGTPVESLDPEPSAATSMFYDVLDSLAEDALSIADVLFHTPFDLQLLLSTRDGARVTQRALCEFFSDWGDDRLYAAFDDLSEALA